MSLTNFLKQGFMKFNVGAKDLSGKIILLTGGNEGNYIRSQHEYYTKHIFRNWL
jgi:hypothetical protein